MNSLRKPQNLTDSWVRLQQTNKDMRFCTWILFEKTVLRKIFGTKREEITGEWRNLHNSELHELYSPPNIIRNLKMRRLRWAGHVAHMGQ